MTLGIFVEGESDELTLPILIRKLGYSSRIYAHPVQQGEMLNVREMSQQIAALMRRSRRKVSRILIFTDSEGVEPGKTLDKTVPVAAQLNQLTRSIPVNYIVVDHSLEGWLLCDQDALRAVLGPRARISVRVNPENHPRPAELMAQIFRANDRVFTKTVDDPRIAEHVTAQNILEKSPTFRRLAAALGGSA